MIERSPCGIDARKLAVHGRNLELGDLGNLILAIDEDDRQYQRSQDDRGYKYLALHITTSPRDRGHTGSSDFFS